MNVFRHKAAQLLSSGVLYSECQLTGEQIANTYKEMCGFDLDVLKTYDYATAYMSKDVDETLLAWYISQVQTAFYAWMQEEKHGKPNDVETAYNQCLVWNRRLGDKLRTPKGQPVKHMWSH